MRKTISLRRFHKIIAAAIFTLLGTILSPAQLRNTTAVVEQVDAAVKARSESIAGYTVTEHYAVYRNKDEVHPVAEMTVNTCYQKNTGKSYVIVAQSGSEIIRNLVLSAILLTFRRSKFQYPRIILTADSGLARQFGIDEQLRFLLPFDENRLDLAIVGDGQAQSGRLLC
jgi:hypothetical protein